MYLKESGRRESAAQILFLYLPTLCYTWLNMDRAPKIEPTEQELSAEQKKNLAQAWSELVLGRQHDSSEVEGFNNEQMRAWLYDSLMSEARVLRDEWGLAPDIKEYKEAMAKCADDKERGDAQFKFIQIMNEKAIAFVHLHSQGKDRPRRFESWPKTMRESKSFNCVGATLFAFVSLEEAGISCILGNPFGHALAIAQLADGERVYIDLNNENVFPVKGEEKKIAGVNCFVINDGRTDYEIISIRDRHEIIDNILGNLKGVVDETQDENHRHESEEQKARLHEIYSAGSSVFKMVDFEALRDSLFGSRKKYWNADDEEFRVEEGKIFLLRDLALLFGSSEAPVGLKKELSNLLMQQPELVKGMMIDIAKDQIPGASPLVIEMLKDMHMRAWRMSGNQPKSIEKAVEHLRLKIALGRASSPTSS